MGCQALNRPKSENAVTSTRFGIATITVLKVYRENVARGQIYESYLTLSVTNQSHQSKQFDERGYPFSEDCFKFLVNSRFQAHGRALAVEFWEKGTFSDKSIGIGMTDFNALI